MAKRKMHACRRVKGGACLCHKGKRQVFAKKSHCR
jgi:hypothetical protein